MSKNPSAFKWPIVAAPWPRITFSQVVATVLPYKSSSEKWLSNPEKSCQKNPGANILDRLIPPLWLSSPHYFIVGKCRVNPHPPRNAWRSPRWDECRAARREWGGWPQPQARQTSTSHNLPSDHLVNCWLYGGYNYWCNIYVYIICIYNMYMCFILISLLT